MLKLKYKMKHTLLFFLILTLLSCKENNQAQLFEGNIFITLINIYDVNTIRPKDKRDEFRKSIIDFASKGKSESEKEMAKYYKALIDNDLFDKSSFQIKLKSNEIINVYVIDKEYLKLKKELKGLDKDKEQVKVTFEGSKISDGVFNRAIYSASKIVFLEKTAGKTDWIK